MKEKSNEHFQRELNKLSNEKSEKKAQVSESDLIPLSRRHHGFSSISGMGMPDHPGPQRFWVNMPDPRNSSSAFPEDFNLK